MIVSALLIAAGRGSVIILAGAIVTWALRSRSAALRHSIWTFAIASQLVLPVAGLLIPQRTVSVGQPGTAVMRVASAVGTALSPAKPQVSGGGLENPDASRVSLPAAQPPASQGPSVLRILTVLWIAGALIILLRFVIGTLLVALETRKATRQISRDWILLAGRIQEDMNLYRPATLVWGTKRAVPFTWGIISPMVCLPSDADTWSTDRLRMVITHELAHIERFDSLTEFMAQLALVVFWFNPLLWLAVARMRTEREHACDDRVLTRGVKPSIYVEELVMMMKSIGQGGIAPGFGAIAMARRSQFESRMLAVLNERTPRSPVGRRRIAALAAGTLVLLLGAASVRPVMARTNAASLGRPTSSAPAETWAQSDFDEMVADCRAKSPKVGVQYCEVRVIDLPAITGTLDFRGGYIDGVIFTSKTQPRTVTARALVRAEALTPADARAMAARVTTSFRDGALQSAGPGGGRSNSWWVLYEVTLPAGRSVRARTELGQISLRDFQGNADIAAVNGPLQVFGAAGNIQGRTESGPIYVGLSGAQWNGAGLDLQSQNGPIYLSIPAGYSAHLVTGTTNGPLELAYPVLVRRMTSKRIDADIGSGGPTVRVTTLNGPADIQ